MIFISTPLQILSYIHTSPYIWTDYIFSFNRIHLMLFKTLKLVSVPLTRAGGKRVRCKGRTCGQFSQGNT